MDTGHDEVELRAYELWEKRGYPLGEPDTDWFAAEKDITDKKSPLLKVAREVGGALGTIVSALVKHGS
jgi:Protein of unknown function (DUF2934)